MAQLKDRNVLITGALGTIGQALVARYVEEGANVIALDRPDAPNAQEVLDGIGTGIRYFGCDLNDLAELERSITALADEVGGIDVLVNNAALVIFKHHDEFSIEEYEDQVRDQFVCRLRPLAGVLEAYEGQALRQDRQHHLAGGRP